MKPLAKVAKVRYNGGKYEKKGLNGENERTENVLHLLGM